MPTQATRYTSLTARYRFGSGFFFGEPRMSKMTKGSMPKQSNPGPHKTSSHGSRSVNTSFSDKVKVRNNAGGHVTGDSRKSVASKTA